MSARSAPVRRRLSAEERRAEILAAALEVFAERGYHAASIDDIAGAAGISKALIYEHFRSKQDLHLELLEESARELLERIGAAVAGTTAPAERLEAGVDAFLRFVEERRGAWRMLFREASDPTIVEVIEDVIERVTSVVAALIAEDPSSRNVPGDDADRAAAIGMLARMLVGSVQSLANWWADHRELPRERLVKLVMDFSWLGLERLRAGERWTEPGT